MFSAHTAGSLPALIQPDTSSEHTLGSTTALPISNSQNQVLESEVITKQQSLESLQYKIDSLDRQNQLLQERIELMNRELKQNKELLHARRSETQSEKQMVALIEQEINKLKTEIKRVQAEIDETNRIQTTNKGLLLAQTKHLAELHEQNKHDHQKFQSHLSKILETDDVNIATQKYMIRDEKLFGELDVNIGQLTKNLHEQQNSFQRLNAELRAVEMALEKSKLTFKDSQAERHTLIERWQQAVDVLQNKEREEAQITEKLAEVREKKFKIEDSVSQSSQTAKSLDSSIQSTEQSINRYTAMLARLRTDLMHTETKYRTTKDEAKAIDLMISQVNSTNAGVARQLSQLQGDLALTQQKLESVQQEKEKRKLAVNDTSTTNQSLAEINRLIKEETEKAQALTRTKEKLKIQLTKQRDQTAVAKREVKSEEVNVEKSKKFLKNLTQSQKSALTQQANRQTDVELKDREIQRISIGSGLSRDTYSKSDQSAAGIASAQAQNELQILRETIADRTASKTELTNAINQSQTELKDLKKDVENKKGEKLKIIDHEKHVKAEVEGMERSRITLAKQKDQLSADTNLMVMNLKRLEDSFLSQHTEVSDLAAEKENAETSLKTYQDELKKRKQFLQAECVAAEDTRRSESQRYKEYAARVALLKNKYDSFVLSMRPSDGYAGTKSHLHDVADKTTKERNELHEKQLDLTDKIQKAERELYALNNTVTLLSSGNTEIHQSVSRINEAENEEKNVLENQLKNLDMELGQRQKLIKGMLQDIETLKAREAQLKEELGDKRNDLPSKQVRIDNLQKEVADIEKKLKTQFTRQKQLSRHWNSERKIAKRDAELETIYQLNESVTDAFAQVMKLYPESVEAVLSKFKESHLKAPSSPTNSKLSADLLSNEGSFDVAAIQSSARQK